jgi:hypothetical protein
VTQLFLQLSSDQLDAECQDRIAELRAAGYRVTLLRYLPTNAIDIVIHDLKRPRARAMRALAEKHLRDASAAGGVQ